VHRISAVCCAFFLCVLSSNSSQAHGGVVEEDDLCLIKVSYLSAHFKIYQPDVSGHKQFCEDLPVAAESIFVMEYQHDSLASMPIDFRIIRDITGKGRFARMEDVESIADLAAATVFYQEARLEPDVYTVLHEFAEEGEFIGIVTATHPENGTAYAAVFPFEVGFTGLGYWPFFIALLLAIQLQYLYMSGRLQRLRRMFGATAVLTLLIFSPDGVYADEVTVDYSVIDGELAINQMQSWLLHIADANGVAIEGAEIEVTGGMPEHDHGLPTAPRITADLGGGNYRLDGMRFHMSGYWELTFVIRVGGRETIVVIPLQL